MRFYHPAAPTVAALYPLRPIGRAVPQHRQRLCEGRYGGTRHRRTESSEILPGAHGPKAYSARLKQLKADPHYDKSMDNATEQYLDYLKSLALSFSAPPFVTLESRVDCSRIAPGSFGRADCIMMGDGRLCVIDYKNGARRPGRGGKQLPNDALCLGGFAGLGPHLWRYPGRNPLGYCTA